MGRATLTGFHRPGRGITDADLSLSCELDRPAFESVIRPLVPLLADARAERPRDTFTLRLADGTIPLDGDPSDLAGTFSIDLGPARLELVEGLRRFLIAGALRGEAVPASRPLELRLRAGRVTCEELALPLATADGDALDLVLEGGYALGGEGVDLQTELPLRLVGPEVNALLHAVREHLRPEMPVPIVVGGAASDLDLSVRPQWIKTVSDVLEGMVPDVLKANLRRLLADEEERER